MDTDNSSPRHLPSLAPLSFPGGQPHHPQQGQQQRSQQQQQQQQQQGQHIQHPQHHSHHPLSASFATGSAGRRNHPEDAIHSHQHQGGQHVPGGSSSVVPSSFNPAGAPPGYWQPMFDVPQSYSPYGHGNPNPAAYSPWTSLHPSSANAAAAGAGGAGPNPGPGGNRPQENPDQPSSAYGVQAYQLGGHLSLQQQQTPYGSYQNSPYYPSYDQQAWPPRPSPQQPPGQKRSADKETDNDGRQTDPSSASDHHQDGESGSRARQGTFQNPNSLPFPPPSSGAAGASSSGQPHHFPPTFNPNDPYGPYGYPPSSSQPGQPQAGPSLPSMNFGPGGQNQPYGQQPNGYYYPPQPQLPPPSALGGANGGNNNGGVDMSMVTGSYPPFDVESGDWQGIHPAGKKQKLSGPSSAAAAAAFAAFTAGSAGAGVKPGHHAQTGEGPTGKPKKEKKERIPKAPKEPKEPKPPKAPKEPKVKIPKEPKEPKLKEPKEPKEPKAKKEKTGTAKDAADASVPTKSHLKPPRKPLSAWQIYFNQVLAARKTLIKPGERFNVAEIAKEAGKVYQDLPESEKAVYIAKAKEVKAEYLAAMASYTATLTPSDIRQENLFRASQRKAGKSRAANLKDPNAPKPPLSPYFLYLRAIRASDEMTREIFRGEKETTKQSIKAAERWKTLTEDEKRPYTSAAEAEKRSFEIAQRQYMIDTGGPVPPIHPPRTHKPKSTSSQAAAAAAASASASGTYQESNSVPLVPESIQSFKPQQHHLQPHQLHPTVPLSVGFNPNSSSSPSRSSGEHNGPDSTISPSHPGFDDPHDLSTGYHHHHHLSAVGSGSGPEDHLGEFDPIFAGVDVDVADHAHDEGDDSGPGGFGGWSIGASEPGRPTDSRLGGNKRQRQDDDDDEDDQANDRRGDREDDDEDDEDEDEDDDDEDEEEASGSGGSSHGNK